MQKTPGKPAMRDATNPTLLCFNETVYTLLACSLFEIRIP